MKRFLRVFTGVILLVFSTLLAFAAITAWLHGDVRPGFGAFFGSLAFLIAAIMTIGRATWRVIVDFMLSFWWL